MALEDEINEVSQKADDIKRKAEAAKATLQQAAQIEAENKAQLSNW